MRPPALSHPLQGAVSAQDVRPIEGGTKLRFEMAYMKAQSLYHISTLFLLPRVASSCADDDADWGGMD